MSRYLLVTITVLSLLAGPTLARGKGRISGGWRGGSRGGGSRGGGHGWSWGGSHSNRHSSSTSGGHGSSSHSAGSGKSWFSWPWSKSSSASHTYPSSNGLSGNNAGHAYPPSGGLSGHGAQGAPPPYGFRAPVPGFGHQPPVYQRQSANPSHSSSVGSLGTGGYYNTGSNNYQKTSYNTGSMPQANPYPLYSGPTPIYIQQVRNSGSRYSDIMTGLALWNLGRSHTHHHYYHNSYPTNNDHSSNSNSEKTLASTSVPRDDVNCTLKMSSNNYTEILKVPCKMVSTFMPNDTKASSETMKSNATHNVTTSTAVPATSVTSIIPDNNMTSVMPPLVGDPLKVPGSKFIVPENMTCTIEVRSPRSIESTAVACDVLLQYAESERVKNSPTPSAPSLISPSKAQVRKWYDAPPFWLVVPFML